VAAREFSAGGVVVRKAEADRYDVAVIKPGGRNVTALPKGHIDPGETAEVAAQREVQEETGIVARLDSKLGDVKYFFRFRGKGIFKVVSFFLFHAVGGEIDQLPEHTRIEVDRAFWLPLEEATERLTYRGERDMAELALERLSGREPKDA